jgi:hypothetical protein
MTERLILTLALTAGGLGLLPGCSSDSRSSASEPVLTAELAKDALLDRMRSKAGLPYINRFDTENWAKVEIRAGKDGSYDFGGLFRINPSKKTYTMLIRPRSGVKACSFEFRGEFIFREGKWLADSPKESRSALERGD